MIFIYIFQELYDIEFSRRKWLAFLTSIIYMQNKQSSQILCFPKRSLQFCEEYTCGYFLEFHSPGARSRYSVNINCFYRL